MEEKNNPRGTHNFIKSLYTTEEMEMVKEKLKNDFKLKGVSQLAYAKLIDIPVTAFRDFVTKGTLPRPMNMAKMLRYVASLNGQQQNEEVKLRESLK